MGKLQVDAIQACGGQRTADGRRFRTGGGILWSILKVREPKVFKEIMKKTKEFEVCDFLTFHNFVILLLISNLGKLSS